MLFRSEANENYKFTAWTPQNNQFDTLSTDLIYEFIVSSDSSLTAHFILENSISEKLLLNSLVVSPNPSNDNYTIISLDLLEFVSIKIDLCDIFGRKIRQIYDDFADVGEFIQKVSLNNLAKGTYYLKIQIGKEYILEKVIVN